MDEARFNEVVALGKQPISEQSPAGDPIRYDESFEALQAEVDKINSLTGEEPNWREVVSLATDILKNKSKDLLVMTYMAVGLFELEGYKSFVAGLESYREFIANFWEKCYPKIRPPQGRYNAVQYLADRIMPSVELKGGQCKRQPTAGEKAAVHQCSEKLDQLVEAMEKSFAGAGESPNLLPLSRAFRALKEKVGPLVAETPPAEAAGPTAAGDGTAPPAASAEPRPALSAAPAGGASVPDQFTSATQATQAIIRVAKYLIGQDNKDARGYRLMRAVQFGVLADLPKDRLLPAVPATRKTFLENMATKGDWLTLLTEAEGQFAVTPLWLDLQRYVTLALTNLGPAYGAARHSVAFECVALHSRLPELFELSFKDGTPFADGATRAWLTELRGEFGGGGNGAAVAGDALGKAVAEARKLLGAAKAPEAVKCLSDAIDSSGSRRQRFRAQLALAGMCLDMNKLILAESILVGLEATMDQYHLDDWEPELGGEVMARLYDCMTKARPKPTPEETRRMSDVFARLCRLDPAAALKLEPARTKA